MTVICQTGTVNIMLATPKQQLVGRRMHDRTKGSWSMFNIYDGMLVRNEQHAQGQTTGKLFFSGIFMLPAMSQAYTMMCSCPLAYVFNFELEKCTLLKTPVQLPTLD